MEETTLMYHCRALCMDEADTLLDNAFVVVQGATIRSVGTERPAGTFAHEIDCHGNVLMPGLVNAHTHIPMTLLRGYGGGCDLQTWLNDWIFPAEAKLDDRAVKAGAGLALAELIASVSKPSATLVLGVGHSIGIPLAVSAQRSFIVPTATMTVHPVRHSGVILGVPQTMHWFDQMQQRITGFVAAHSGMTEKRYTELMLHTGELVMDMGTVLDGRRAVKEKLIDELGGLSDALDWLHRAIETRE